MSSKIVRRAPARNAAHARSAKSVTPKRSPHQPPRRRRTHCVRSPAPGTGCRRCRTRRRSPSRGRLLDEHGGVVPQHHQPATPPVGRRPSTAGRRPPRAATVGSRPRRPATADSRPPKRAFISMIDDSVGVVVDEDLEGDGAERAGKGLADLDGERLESGRTDGHALAHLAGPHLDAAAGHGAATPSQIGRRSSRSCTRDRGHLLDDDLGPRARPTGSAVVGHDGDADARRCRTAASPPGGTASPPGCRPPGSGARWGTRGRAATRWSATLSDAMATTSGRRHGHGDAGLGEPLPRPRRRRPAPGRSSGPPARPRVDRTSRSPRRRTRDGRQPGTSSPQSAEWNALEYHEPVGGQHLTVEPQVGEGRAKRPQQLDPSPGRGDQHGKRPIVRPGHGRRGGLGKLGHRGVTLVAHALAPQHQPDGGGHDAQVEGDRTMVDVPEVQCQPLVPGVVLRPLIWAQPVSPGRTSCRRA